METTDGAAHAQPPDHQTRVLSKRPMSTGAQRAAGRITDDRTDNR